MSDNQQSLQNLIENELNKEDIKLPIIDEIAASLSKVLSSEDINIRELASLIEKDPALTAKALNLANSVVYAGLVKIKTIDQAIVRVGLLTIKHFLIASYLKDSFSKISKEFKDMMNILWKHSLACAICCKKIADNLNLLSVSEDAYLLGLLHDIGIISIFNILSELNTKENNKFELNDSLIKEIVKTFHSSTGAKILKKMNFDDNFCRIVEFHDRPGEFGQEENNLFNILNVADNLLYKIGLALDPDTSISIVGLKSTERLKLDPLFIAVLEVDIEDMMNNSDMLL